MRQGVLFVLFKDGRKSTPINPSRNQDWPPDARHETRDMRRAKDVRPRDTRLNFQTYSHYYRSFSCFLTKIFTMRFSVARSAFTTAAAAGAVCIILNQRLVSSLNPQDVVGPAARLFSVFSVFCGLKFRALSCLSWLLKTFGCGQWPRQVFCGSIKNSCHFVSIRG